MFLLDGWPVNGYLENLRNEKKEKYAWKIIDDFYQFFDGESPKETLRDMLTIYLIIDREDITGKLRSNMIFFYSYCEALFEAVSFLNDKQANNKRKGKKG